MNSRGFFSVILATFAVILFIALIYAQSARDDTETRANQLLAVQQELSKNWFMARNAYSNFAADAMADQIKTDVPPAACTFPVATTDFSGNIQSYWDDVKDMLESKGIDCTAVLSNELYNDLGESNHASLEVHSGERAYGILTCLASAGSTTLNMTQPFVIKKEVLVSVPSIGQCNVQVYDNLGAFHVAKDVDITYS